MRAAFEVKPGSPEFRLSRVDGSATVDVGAPQKFNGKLGPAWKASKWNGRGWLEISGMDIDVNRGGEIKSHPKFGDVYECECVRKVKGKPRAERHRIVPGSVEYQIEWDTLKDVPETDYVDLLLDFSGDLTWSKQLPLTQKEIDEGCERPENVVNSYAIYGAQTGRIVRDGVEAVNYESGKFGHLYRSQLIDAKGNRQWLDQTAPMASPNRLRVYLDRGWLSGAAFPVVLDPTFGYTSAGASVSTGPAGGSVVAFGRSSPSENGSVTEVSFYGRGRFGSSNITGGLYTGDGTNPTTLLIDSGESSITTTSAWKSLELDSATSVQSSVDYWIAFALSAQCLLYYDSGADSGNGYWGGSNSYTSGQLPSTPLVGLFTDSAFYSAYATYGDPPAATGHPTIKRFGGIPYATLNKGTW